jgi:hypothetical protein
VSSVSLFKGIPLALLLFIVTGCATQNFMSSEGFEIHVSEKRYLNESCENLDEMYKNIQSKPLYYARLYMGLGPYSHEIAPKYENQIISLNQIAITNAIQKKC